MATNGIWVAAVVALALGVAGASQAAAQAPPTPAEPAGSAPRNADEDARAHFDAGRVAYAAGDFETAVTEFRRAYVLSGRFALLFNIGMAELRAGRDSAALTAFEGYRRQAPADAPDLGQVEERIRVLRGMGVQPEPEGGATPETDEAEAAPPDLSAAPTESGPRSPAPFILMGGGGALLVAGGVLMGLGAARASDVTGAPSGSMWPELQDTADRAKLLWGMGLGFGAVGLAAIAGGLTWHLAGGDSDDDTAASARLQLGFGTLTLEGAF